MLLNLHVLTLTAKKNKRIIGITKIAKDLQKSEQTKACKYVRRPKMIARKHVVVYLL